MLLYVQLLSIAFKLIKYRTPLQSLHACEMLLCRPAWLASLSAEGLSRDIMEEYL